MQNSRFLEEIFDLRKKFARFGVFFESTCRFPHQQVKANRKLTLKNRLKV